MGTQSIVVVPDPHLGRERAQSLVRTWAILRTLCSVKVLSPKTEEPELLDYLEKNPADLVLLPWSRYLQWAHVEGHFGLSRNSGPTSAGYFAAPVDSREIGPSNDFQRLILLDFAQTSFSERWRMVRSLLNETYRSGVEHLIADRAPIYMHDWLGADGPGPLLDSVLSLEALSQSPWRERIQPIELMALSLWNLAFERSRALSRGGWLDQIHAQRIRAHFELTLDAELLALRLCYKQSPNTPKSVMRDFWPDPDRAEDFRQLLVQQSDFVRVHPVTEQEEIEIVAGLLKSAPARHRPGELRTIWVEPIAPRLMNEIAPSARRTLLMPESSPVVADPHKSAARIQWLERELELRDQKIVELTQGTQTKKSA
jgi:hypothetical protein